MRYLQKRGSFDYNQNWTNWPNCFQQNFYNVTSSSTYCCNKQAISKEAKNLYFQPFICQLSFSPEVKRIYQIQTLNVSISLN